MKIKIINWHLFANETIEIKNNTVITGENGTGKSTLLDALQYVLTAGKAKFNSAANDSGKRTLEGYIRGKLGREGKEFLRNGDVVSYIVLEYFDETSKRSQLLGVIFELNKSNIKKELFFQLIDQKINDKLFFDGNHIYNRNEFRRNTKKMNIISNFIDKKSNVPSLYRQALGVSQKYFQLIPRALAFKPINHVYNFIFDFLLNEDPVKIDDLRNNIRAYRNLGNILKDQQNRLESLEKVENFYLSYQKAKINCQNHQIAKDLLYIDSLNYEKDKLTVKIDKVKHSVSDLRQLLIVAKEESERWQKEVVNLENILENNEGYRLKRQLENTLEIKQSEHRQKKIRFDDYQKKLKQEAKLLKQLRVKESFVDTIKENNYDSNYLNENLYDIRNDLANRRNDLSEQKIVLKQKLKSLRQEYNGLVDQHELLRQNRFVYRQEIKELINVLKQELHNYYHQNIDVKPMCEYLEITDESWRDAIEGYLNTQRFDIIIEPEYFVKAVEIYEQFKESHGIFGVGIVDVAKLEKYQETNLDSLANYVTSYNSYAKNYANMLLNRVICVDKIEDLRNYRTAITRTCMVYNNFTVRAINPRVYLKPYIGLEAMKIQKEIVETKLNKLDVEIKNEKRKYDDVDHNIKIINQSQIESLISFANIVDEYHNLDNDIQETKIRLEDIIQDDSIISLMEQLDKVTARYQKAQNDYDLKQRQLLNLDNDLTKCQERVDEIIILLQQLPPIPEVIDDNIEKIRQRYLKKYNKKYETMQNNLLIRIRDLEKDVDRENGKLEWAMKSFNHEFKVGFGETIDSIEMYLQLYYKLRDIEIVKRQDDVRNARRKCEQSFQESFISRLNEKINQAKKDIKDLNKGLQGKNFNGDSYEFEVNPSRRKEYRRYYDIITSNQQYNSDDLFVTTLSNENRLIMDELFNQIALLDEDESGEKLLQKYTDYREYLDYDIKITHENGDFTKFSKVNREKSGGETQTPFYVVIASSFEQLIKNRVDEDSGCVVLFDEAFNNMDEPRIEAMMKFYSELNVQIILAVPPTRAATIMPYVDTTLAIIKDNDYSFVESVIHE
ncbi:SbcC/MukB-like Walker B domain-containing protein [uncultured Thomasclavelia sp.]|uniref:ATP-binding protein n=1 Tax=uncultured Thomasclavelia sp. TaxID=3025759 RepID=UPI00280B5BD9|nr:SbcC/MukB-like Walker B domain-containing protein [uncultured Thomasclavelia sp.]